jgi:alpha-L-fucosidase
MPDGRIEPRQVEVLEEIGDWMDVNGEAIYGTRGGPWLPNDIWASTNKGKKIYLLVMATEVRLLQVPLLEGMRIKKAKILGGGDVKIEVGKTIMFSLPENLPSNYANVIELTTNGVFPTMDNIIVN